MNKKLEYVWLIEERTFAELVSMGASFSRVKYTRGGIDYEVLVENDEFEYRKADDIDTNEG